MIKDLKASECFELLGNNCIGRLSFIKGTSPYILPITYFYDAEDKCILSYSAEGHKIEAMRTYPSVTLQVDEIKSIQNWRSVQVHGKFEELDGSTAKRYLHRFAQGVQETIERMKGEKPKFIQDFSSRLQERDMPIVYRISVTDIVGKSRGN